MIFSSNEVFSLLVVILLMNSYPFFQFFDQVKIEDPRVHDLCNKAGQPGPFQILCECLRRLVIHFILEQYFDGAKYVT